MKKLILGIIVVIIILGIGSYIFISHHTPSPKSSITSSILSSNDSKAAKSNISTNNSNIPQGTTSLVSSSNDSRTAKSDISTNNSNIPQDTTSPNSNVIANKSTTTANNNLKSNSHFNNENIIDKYNLVGTWLITDISAYPLNTNGQNTNLTNEKIIIEPNLFKIGTVTINDPIYGVKTLNLEGELGNPGDKGYIVQNNGNLNFLTIRSKNNSENNCTNSIIFNKNIIQVINSTSYIYNAKRIS